MKISPTTRKILAASAGVSIAIAASSYADKARIPVARAIKVTPATNLFNQADTNKDGVLSAKEFEAAYAKIQAEAARNAAKVAQPKKLHLVDPLADGCPGCGLG